MICGSGSPRTAAAYDFAERVRSRPRALAMGQSGASVRCLMADRSRCPSCGERVSPYAAGCAVCGADLDTARWDKGPGAGRQMASWLSAMTFGGIPAWVLWLVAAIVLAVILGVL